ncbi:hypothetical protein C8F04DRAFT_1176801 [Mycena alexandri]|uniref:Uncharacterized protein n=1 Tax=Mycena alexandri TaxID=1745969 RepID=A0AAD6X7C1_9AGAR|nr:hypothetical protein C8F04DRAFT_1176801 [Mycena alexandri]
MSTSEQSRDTPITVPTTSPGELTTASEPTLGESVTTVTTTNTNDADLTEDDIRLANEYFERIGKRERIHQWAVTRHSKELTQASLQRVIYTFDKLNRTQTQTPPPLLFGTTRLDVQAALARGRATAFSEDTAEAEMPAADQMGSGERGDVLDDIPVVPFSDLDEAKAALDHIQNLVKRLIPGIALD